MFNAPLRSSAMLCRVPNRPFGKLKPLTTVLKIDVCSKRSCRRVCGAVYAETTIAGTRGPRRSNWKPMPPGSPLTITLSSGLIATLLLSEVGGDTCPPNHGIEIDGFDERVVRKPV